MTIKFELDLDEIEKNTEEKKLEILEKKVEELKFLEKIAEMEAKKLNDARKNVVRQNVDTDISF